jgi:uncharacterized protein (TIGR02147 family)
MKTNATSVPSPPTPANSFRLLLQDELARRCARNARYSLRSFARALAVDHSTLSQVLRGRRALSARAIERLGRRLGLTPADIERYVDAERSDRSEPASAMLPEVEQLTHDAVRLVTEWHHYAILELCRLDTFQADSRWIARVLGIEVDAVNLAVSRLARLGLLHMSARGRWTDRSGNTAVSLRAFPEVAFRHLFEQVRQLTVAAAQRAGRLERPQHHDPRHRERAAARGDQAHCPLPQGAGRTAGRRREARRRLPLGDPPVPDHAPQADPGGMTWVVP